MKQFFLTVLGVFTGLVLFLVIVPIALIMMAAASAGSKPSVPRNTVLELDLRQGVSDSPSTNPLSFGGAGLSVIEIVDGLAQAGDDAAVKVVLLILIGLLRALVAPLLLMATVVLSFGAALGISALLFEYVFGFAGADPGFPLFAFVFLVALGIDYNIFLMTRVREETVNHGTRQGSLIALSATGGVINIFTRKVYCRYVCPLGAALSISSKVRLFDWLKRRPECGSPCQLCAKECEIQAIHPDGHINHNECHYCLDCQMTYHNENKCPPLILKNKRAKRGKKAPADPSLIPVVQVVEP